MPGEYISRSSDIARDRPGRLCLELRISESADAAWGRAAQAGQMLAEPNRCPGSLEPPIQAHDKDEDELVECRYCGKVLQAGYAGLVPVHDFALASMAER